MNVLILLFQLFRLSRARRTIENCFGIMASKWRILLKSIETSPAVADTIVQAICVLYNFDIDESRHFRPEQLVIILIHLIFKLLFLGRSWRR